MSTFWGVTRRLEPKRSFRATLDISSPAVRWPRYLITKFSRPGVTEMLQPVVYGMPKSGTPFPKMQPNIQYQSAPKYKPLQITLIEDSRSRRNNTSLTVYTFLSYLGFTGETVLGVTNLDEGPPPTAQVAGATLARDVIGNQWSINELRPNGSTFASWTIQQPYVQSAVFSDYDYNSEELATVTLEVQYRGFTYEDKRRPLSSRDPGFDSSVTTGAPSNENAAASQQTPGSPGADSANSETLGDALGNLGDVIGSQF